MENFYLILATWHTGLFQLHLFLTAKQRSMTGTLTHPPSPLQISSLKCAIANLKNKLLFLRYLLPEAELI